MQPLCISRCSAPCYVKSPVWRTHAQALVALQVLQCLRTWTPALPRVTQTVLCDARMQALVELQVLQYIKDMDPKNEHNCVHITVGSRQGQKCAASPRCITQVLHIQGTCIRHCSCKALRACS